VILNGNWLARQIRELRRERAGNRVYPTSRAEGSISRTGAIGKSCVDEALFAAPLPSDTVPTQPLRSNASTANDRLYAFIVLRPPKHRVELGRAEAAWRSPEVAGSTSLREPEVSHRALPRVSQETLAEMIGTTRSRVNLFITSSASWDSSNAMVVSGSTTHS
jgi:hypothetical protein